MVSQNKNPEVVVGFIGAGRLGTALAVNCYQLGYQIGGVYDRSVFRARRLVGQLKMSGVTTDLARLVRTCDVIFLVVPDRMIKPVYQRIKTQVKKGVILVHCAGVFGTEIFADAVKRRIETLALHPVQTFTSTEGAIEELRGGFFTIDGTLRGVQFGRELIKGLNGRVVFVKSEMRPLYHAMCVFASNFINALLSAGEEIGEQLGFSRRKALDMLLPLARKTLENIAQHGAIKSLTGPVQRGDRKTVACHIKALKQSAPELVPLYQVLTKRLEMMVQKKKQRSKRCTGNRYSYH